MGYSWEMYLKIDQLSGDFLFKIKKPALLYFVKKCEFFFQEMNTKESAIKLLWICKKSKKNKCTLNENVWCVITNDSIFVLIFSKSVSSHFSAYWVRLIFLILVIVYRKKGAVEKVL